MSVNNKLVKSSAKNVQNYDTDQRNDQLYDHDGFVVEGVVDL